MTQNKSLDTNLAIQLLPNALGEFGGDLSSNILANEMVLEFLQDGHHVSIAQGLAPNESTEH